MPHAFPDDCLRVTLDAQPDDSRLLRVQPTGARYETLARQLHDYLQDGALLSQE